MPQISLRDYYSTEEAFSSNSDRMIRIAAIHHAANRLENNPKLKDILNSLLMDPDSLIALYASITLAQAGEKEGIQYLVQKICVSQGPEREHLNECLHNCTEFPFAVLVNKLIFIESIAKIQDKEMQEFLHILLYLTGDRFYELSKQDVGFRKDLFKQLSMLQSQQGRICQSGWILSIPMGKQPGFLVSQDSKLFLKFNEDIVLNRKYLQKGREILFITNTKQDNYNSELIYILEDKEPQTVEISTQHFQNTHELGLQPGIVINKREKLVEVICSNGTIFTEVYRSQKASLSQFALVEETTNLGRSQCHFLFGFQLKRSTIQTLISEYTKITKNFIAQIKEIRDARTKQNNRTYSMEWDARNYTECLVQDENNGQIIVYIPSPSLNKKILLSECSTCQAKGNISCDKCNGDGYNLCYGNYNCFRCKGSGSLDDGRECILCEGTGQLNGCHGRGEINCPVCDGDGEIECENCDGTGEYKPRRECPKCGGSGEFTVTCKRCDGEGEFTVTCNKCDGSGSFGNGDCYKCDGTGEVTLDCKICDGDGEITLNCKACDGTGYWEAQSCNKCEGSGSLECYYCHGDENIECPVCHGKGKLACKKCNSSGTLICPSCQGDVYIFRAKLDCL